MPMSRAAKNPKKNRAVPGVGSIGLVRCKKCLHYEHYSICNHPDICSFVTGKGANALGVIKYGACDRNDMFTPNAVLSGAATEVKPRRDV